MAEFTVLIKESAQREFDALEKKDRELVGRRITALAIDPRPQGCKSLKGKRFKGLFRIRSGNYRIVYQVQDERLVVLIVKIGDRKDVYE